MSVYFFDASAVVKYFHREPGSVWIRQMVDAWNPGQDRPVNEIYMADISLAEVPAALSVLSRTGQIRSRIRNLMHSWAASETNSVCSVLQQR